MGYWLGIVFSCLDVLCVAVFCDAFLERKTRGLRFVVGALLCGVLSYIATIFVSHIYIKKQIHCRVSFLSHSDI